MPPDQNDEPVLFCYLTSLLSVLPFPWFSCQNRPFSPPVHSSSPPPLAPLARAESTSSISSTNSLSAATTPTVGKELSVSVSGVTPFPIILSALPCCFVFMCLLWKLPFKLEFGKTRASVSQFSALLWIHCRNIFTALDLVWTKPVWWWCYFV